MQPDIEAFFHEPTSTFSYVVSDPESGECAVIDPVLDFDPKSGRTSTEAADRITTFITDKGLDAKWILETHVHADHLSGGSCLRERLDAPIGIGEHVKEVQAISSRISSTPNRTSPPTAVSSIACSRTATRFLLVS